MYYTVKMNTGSTYEPYKTISFPVYLFFPLMTLLIFKFLSKY